MTNTPFSKLSGLAAEEHAESGFGSPSASRVVASSSPKPKPSPRTPLWQKCDSGAGAASYGTVDAENEEGSPLLVNLTEHEDSGSVSVYEVSNVQGDESRAGDISGSILGCVTPVAPPPPRLSLSTGGRRVRLQSLVISPASPSAGIVHGGLVTPDVTAGSAGPIHRASISIGMTPFCSDTDQSKTEAEAEILFAILRLLNLDLQWREEVRVQMAGLGKQAGIDNQQPYIEEKIRIALENKNQSEIEALYRRFVRLLAPTMAFLSSLQNLSIEGSSEIEERKAQAASSVFFILWQIFQLVLDRKFKPRIDEKDSAFKGVAVATGAEVTVREHRLTPASFIWKAGKGDRSKLWPEVTEDIQQASQKRISVKIKDQLKALLDQFQKRFKVSSQYDFNRAALLMITREPPFRFSASNSQKNKIWREWLSVVHEQVITGKYNSAAIEDFILRYNPGIDIFPEVLQAILREYDLSGFNIIVPVPFQIQCWLDSLEYPQDAYSFIMDAYIMMLRHAASGTQAIEPTVQGSGSAKKNAAIIDAAHVIITVANAITYDALSKLLQESHQTSEGYQNPESYQPPKNHQPSVSAQVLEFNEYRYGYVRDDSVESGGYWDYQADASTVTVDKTARRGLGDVFADAGSAASQTQTPLTLSTESDLPAGSSVLPRDSSLEAGNDSIVVGSPKRSDSSQSPNVEFGDVAFSTPPPRSASLNSGDRGVVVQSESAVSLFLSAGPSAAELIVSADQSLEARKDNVQEEPVNSQPSITATASNTAAELSVSPVITNVNSPVKKKKKHPIAIAIGCFGLLCLTAGAVLTGLGVTAPLGIACGYFGWKLISMPLIASIAANGAASGVAGLAVGGALAGVAKVCSKIGTACAKVFRRTQLTLEDLFEKIMGLITKRLADLFKKISPLQAKKTNSSKLKELQNQQNEVDRLQEEVIKIRNQARIRIETPSVSSTSSKDSIATALTTEAPAAATPTTATPKTPSVRIKPPDPAEALQPQEAIAALRKIFDMKSNQASRATGLFASGNSKADLGQQQLERSLKEDCLKLVKRCVV